MNDELKNRLDSWADEPTPKVDGAFANRLESDLRATARVSPKRGPDLGWLFRPSIAMAAVVVIIGVVFVARRDDDAGVRMIAADGATVSIPGAGTTRDGAAGLELPEGSRIIVGPEGSAVVAGVVLEPGSTAVISDGRVDVIDVGRAESGLDTDLPSDTQPATSTTTTAASTTSAAVTDSRPDTTTTTVVSDRSTTTIVEPARSTTTTVVPDSTPSTIEPGTTVPPTTKPPVDPPTIDPVPLSIGLVVGAVRDGQATLQWTVEGDVADIAGWIVRIRRGDSSEVIALVRQPDVRRLRVAIPDRDARFRVVARSADGDVVALSRLVGPRL